MFYRYSLNTNDGPGDMILCDECQKEVDWVSQENKESGGCEYQGDNCQEA